jgi:hypothetical protein
MPSLKTLPDLTRLFKRAKGISTQMEQASPRTYRIIGNIHKRTVKWTHCIAILRIIE